MSTIEDTGVQEYRSSGAQGFRCAGVQEYRRYKELRSTYHSHCTYDMSTREGRKPIDDNMQVKVSGVGVEDNNTSSTSKRRVTTSIK